MSILIPRENMSELYFKITIDGKSLGTAIDRVRTSVEFDDSDDEASLLRLTIADKNRVFLNNPSLLEKKKSITLDIGFLKAHGEVFNGVITHAEASYGEDGIPIITIGAIDESNVMASVAKTRKFTKTKVSSVVINIARDYGFTPNVSDTGTVLDEISQDGESDAKLLTRLADNEAFIWYVYRKGSTKYLFFGSRMNSDAQADDVLDYDTGNFGIISFNPMRVEKNKSADSTSSNLDSSGDESTASKNNLNTTSTQVVHNPSVNVLTIDGSSGRVSQGNLVETYRKTSSNITSQY